MSKDPVASVKQAGRERRQTAHLLPWRPPKCRAASHRGDE